MMFFLSGLQSQPQKSKPKVSLPVIEVMQVNPQNLTLQIPSYGIVEPKYKTQIVAEVSGRLTTISDLFVTGGMVKKGEVLAEIEPFDHQAALTQAQAKLAQAKAALDEELARGEVAKVEFKDHHQGKAPSLGLRLPQIQRERAKVKSAQAELDRAKRNLARTIIRAPYNAIVKSRDIDLGQYVSVGSNLGELYGTDVAEIRLPIPNNELAHLASLHKPTSPVSLVTQLAEIQTIWQGAVVRSEGVIDSENRMLYLVAQVNDPYLTTSTHDKQIPLHFGSFVNAKVQGKQFNDVVTLPRHLLRKNLLTVVSSDNQIEMRQVKVVRLDDHSAYIQGNFKAGERISLTQFSKFSSGQKVKILGDKTQSTTDSESNQKGDH
ncbi:MAG: efflux RND transporter periplasmic adaptor subunit [Parashewanella sp.]